MSWTDKVSRSSLTVLFLWYHARAALFVFVLFCLLPVSLTYAEEGNGDESRSLAEEQISGVENSPAQVEKPELQIQEAQSENSVEGEIESRNEIAYDPMARSIYPKAYYRLRKITSDWERRLGLEITFSYDVVGQHYFDNVEGEWGVAGDASLSGRWLLLGKKNDWPVFLTFRLRHRDAFSDNPPSSIAAETGLYWKTVDGFNDSGFQIPSMYFSQEFHKQQVVLRYGQFSIDHFFDSHRFRSSKKYFLNYAFANNPSVNFPSYGAGAVVQWNPNTRWELIGGASNIQGTQQGDDVNFGLDTAALFESAQVRYRFEGEEDHGSELRIMIWHNASLPEEDLPDDSGVSVTLGLDGASRGEEYAFRIAKSKGNATVTDLNFFAGYGREMFSYDHWGIGVAGGRSSVTSNWQVLLETYYRWRVFKELMITPDLQLIVGEHLDRDTEISVVAGLRLGFIF